MIKIDFKVENVTLIRVIYDSLEDMAPRIMVDVFVLIYLQKKKVIVRMVYDSLEDMAPRIMDVLSPFACRKRNSLLRPADKEIN